MIFFRHSPKPQMKINKIKDKYVSSFNQTYFELLTIMKKYGKTNPKFSLFYANNKAIRITKPTLLISVWHKYINEKYYTMIMNENIEYFLMKNFDGLVSRCSYEEYCVNKALQFMKNIYPQLNEAHLEIVKQKIKKLCIVSQLYIIICK